MPEHASESRLSTALSGQVPKEMSAKKQRCGAELRVGGARDGGTIQQPGIGPTGDRRWALSDGWLCSLPYAQMPRDGESVYWSAVVRPKSGEGATASNRRTVKAEPSVPPSSSGGINADRRESGWSVMTVSTRKSREGREEVCRALRARLKFVDYQDGFGSFQPTRSTGLGSLDLTIRDSTAPRGNVESCAVAADK